jgi:hypothetical protein
MAEEETTLVHEQIKEKNELLSIYERKTIQERMTVSLKEELQLKDEVTKGPNGESKVIRCHEIMDIKSDMISLVSSTHSLISSLGQGSKLSHSMPRHSLAHLEF